MNFFYSISMIFGALFLLNGCSTTRVLSDYDRSVDFTQYKSFNWLPKPSDSSSGEVKNKILEKRFKRLIKEELEYKGYGMDTSAPQFFISYNNIIREREAITYSHHGCFHHGYGHHRRHHHHFGYPYHGGYHTYIYDESTITIDIIDARTNELIWRGWSTDRSYGPSLSEAAIKKAVIGILSRFPPLDEIP